MGHPDVGQSSIRTRKHSLGSAQVCHQEGQDFLLFSAVLQHLHAEPRPSAAAQVALLQRVRAQAAGLQTLFAIPALISCLKVCARRPCRPA